MSGNVIRKCAERLQRKREAWASKLHPDVKAVTGHLHLPFLDWLARHSEYHGIHYVRRLMQGKPALGEIPPTGAFRPERNEASMTLQEWMHNPRERNERMIGSVGSSGDINLDAEAWKKTMKELAKGYIRGPGELSELDLDKTCLTPRWPKWEQKEDGAWTCRNISDWKASQGNATVALSERYSPEDLTTAHAIIRILREVFPSGTRLQGFRVDWEMAFRQEPLWPPHADLHYELVWNPELKRVQWIRPLGGAFGNKAAQANFVEHPHFICHVCRTQLAILLCHYSGNKWAIEPAATARHAHALVLELMDMIGWRYDNSKSPPPAEMFRLLGVEHSLGRSAIVWLCAAKVDKLQRQLRHHKRIARVTAADASTLHGSFNWVRSSLWGRCGAAILSPLRTRQRSKIVGMNSALLGMFDWLEDALMHENGKVVACSLASLELAITVSDGEGTGNVAVALWEMSRPDVKPRITATKLPERILSKWSLHASNARAPIEGIGPLLAMATWPQLTNKLWIHSIDNTDAMNALIKGHCVNNDLNEIMHATWKEIRKRRLHLWVEYVNTHDNPVDKASRGCRQDLYDQGWQWNRAADIMEYLLPFWCL